MNNNSYERLAEIVPLINNQIAVIRYLKNKEGLCTCGRFIKSTDMKMFLANCSHPIQTDKILIAAYCIECATMIDNTLRSLKGIHSHPEPDRIRHEGK